jgi:hypothetical protein
VASPPYEPLTMEALKLPEGFQVPEEASTEFLKVLNDARVPASAAQGLLDLQAKVLSDAETAAETQWNETQAAWRKEIEKLPEIGGANLPATEIAVAKVLDTFGTPELRQMLDITGAGNHPTMVKFLHKLSTVMNEDKLETGNPAPGEQRSRAERMFGNS